MLRICSIAIMAVYRVPTYMKIYFITSKLNFEKSGGSVEEFDLMMRDLQALGNEVVAVTAFSESNKLTSSVPYQLIEESIPKRDLLGIQRGVYAMLKKYEHDADFFHIDGHNFLYGAGWYRRFGGKVPISAFFNRELGSFPEDASLLLGSEKRTANQRVRHFVRWFCERTIGMWFACAIDLKSFITPFYQEMYANFGLRGGVQMVIGDPTDFPKIRKENHVAEHSYRDRIGENRPLRIFFSSRMVAGKGFDLLLAGFARVTNKENFVLILGGNGPEEQKIRALANDLGITKHIEFLGWMTREQLYEEFKRADIFAQVGWRKEGASMTLLYAMAFGIPSIVPEGGGLAWQAGDAALTVRNGDHDALARAIEKLGSDPDLRVELSRRASNRLNDDQMDHEKIVKKWFGEMQKILSTNDSRHG